jgi:hypothetical protein
MPALPATWTSAFLGRFREHVRSIKDTLGTFGTRATGTAASLAEAWASRTQHLREQGQQFWQARGCSKLNCKKFHGLNEDQREKLSRVEKWHLSLCRFSKCPTTQQEQEAQDHSAQYEEDRAAQKGERKPAGCR